MRNAARPALWEHQILTARPSGSVEGQLCGCAAVPMHRPRAHKGPPLTAQWLSSALTISKYLVVFEQGGPVCSFYMGSCK